MVRKFRGKKIFLPTNLLAISQWNEAEVIQKQPNPVRGVWNKE
jgi:hypothetical protein